MGYKTTVHIGMVSDSWFPGDGKQKWLRELMVFELFKIGDSKLGQLFDKYNELPSAQKVFFFASNGNTKIKKDRYGDELVAVPFDEAMEALAFDVKDEEFDSIHIKILYDAMKSIRKHYKKSPLVVTRFGH